MATEANKKRNWWAIVIGAGLALSPIHSLWLTRLTTTESGGTWFFLPTVGVAIWLVGSLFFFVYQDNWLLLKQKSTWGSLWVLVPLIVIVISMCISGAVNGASIGAKFAPGLMGISMLALYLASRVLGKDIFLPLIPMVLIVAASVIVSGIIHPGKITGGLITNYHAAAGFMIFGTVVNRFRWQWLLATVVVVALFFVGSLEGLFAMLVLFIIVLVRRDWGRRLLIPLGVLAAIALLWLGTGNLSPLWGKANLTTLKNVATGEATLDDQSMSVITTNRFDTIVDRMSDTKPFGRGYWVTMPAKADVPVGEKVAYNEPEIEPVHNVPLIIVDQVGPIAGIAWLFIAVYCLIKTKWRYAWVAVLALGVFDHYIWTQFAPFWWVLTGVSLTSTIKNDYIFKVVKTNESMSPQ